MRVSELIEKLQKYPQNSKIMVMDENRYYESIEVFSDTLNLYVILDIEPRYDVDEGDDPDN